MQSYKTMILIPVILAGLLSACSIAQTPEATRTAYESEDLDTGRMLCRTLDQAGPTIDYHTLMQIYETIGRAPGPVASLDQVLERLIYKRNPNPRIDQMILIFSAKIIGERAIPIANARDLFMAILQQESRLNGWVIAFVADGITSYPFDLADGDALVDFMETQLARIRSKERTGEEYFGYHFLPPPKSPFIREYIDGIAEQRLRQQERHRYYLLIVNHMDDAAIESAMRMIEQNGSPGSGARCPLLLECVVRWKLGAGVQ